MKYQCKVCGSIYDNKNEAKKCEKIPITQERGVKKGDFIMLTEGEGKFEDARVLEVGIVGKYTGFKKYLHTIYLVVKLFDGRQRNVLFDNYADDNYLKQMAEEMRIYYSMG